MSAIGRNDPCPCGSGKKYKKCCLIKQEQQDAWANKLANDDFEKWFTEDEALGKQRMAEAIHNLGVSPVLVECPLEEDPVDAEFHRQRQADIEDFKNNP